MSLGNDNGIVDLVTGLDLTDEHVSRGFDDKIRLITVTGLCSILN